MPINFTIDGSWSCNNRGTIAPVNGARLEFWQQVSSWVSWFDQHISSTYTDGNGRYSGSFVSRHRHNLYARLVLNDDQGARLHNWWTGSSWCIDTGTGSNTSGNIHHDLIIVKNGGSGTPKCAIWQGAHYAAQEYRTTVGRPPPDRDYDISLETTIFPTPWSTLSTTHWPDNYDPRGQQGDYSVNFHEFGHTVRHSFDGGFVHFLYDAVRFLYARTHDPTDCRHRTNLGFAFNEGWAEFWASEWGAIPPNAPCDPAADMELEGDVAAALYGLSRCPGVGRSGMVAVLQANRGSIHSFVEFHNAFNRRFPACEVPIVEAKETVAHNAGEEIAVSIAERRAFIERGVHEQEQVTADLRRSYDRALAAAASAEPCDTVDSCEALFQAVTGPPLLAGRILQSEQVSARLGQDLRLLNDGDEAALHGRGTDEVVSLTNRQMYASHLTDQRRFDQETFATVIGATREAMSALSRFVESDRTGTLAAYAHDLGQSLADFEDRRDRGLTPPEGVQPPGGTFGETETPAATQ